MRTSFSFFAVIPLLQGMIMFTLGIIFLFFVKNGTAQYEVIFPCRTVGPCSQNNMVHSPRFSLSIF